MEIKTFGGFPFRLSFEMPKCQLLIIGSHDCVLMDTDGNTFSMETEELKKRMREEEDTEESDEPDA